MSKKSRFLDRPIEPFRVEPGCSAEDILSRMERISFQGRNLATAHRVWQKMLASDALIFLGAAGALSAGGLRLNHRLPHREPVRGLPGVDRRKPLSRPAPRHAAGRHFLGSPHADDTALQKEHIDRVYDTFVSEEAFVEHDIWLAEFALTLERRPYTTREFLYKLGERLWYDTGQEGILTAAYRANIPIFCPAVADSSIGMGLSQARQRDRSAGHVDVIGDIVESANLVIRRRQTASVVLGGGTPKNFINQASVQAEFFSPGVGGHRYALQIRDRRPAFRRGLRGRRWKRRRAGARLPWTRTRLR